MKRIINAALLLALIAFSANQAFATAWTMPTMPPAGPTNRTATDQGHFSYGGSAVTGSLQVTPIGTPSAPTLTTNGTVGSTSLVYACTAVDTNGNATIPSATATITTANATLTTTNSVNVTCPGKSGATAFLIHKADTGHVIGICYTTSGAACTFIDDASTNTVMHGGGTSYTYTANTVDQTGIVPSGIQQCGGQATMTAGALLVTAPCISNVSACSCSVQASSVAIVAADAGCGCIPTTTATVIGGATVTVGAASLFSGATPATSPVINWWAGPK